jgi:hypothetical protein
VPGAANENVTVLGPGVTVPPDTILERKNKVQLEPVPQPAVYSEPASPPIQNGEISAVEA